MFIRNLIIFLFCFSHSYGAHAQATVSQNSSNVLFETGKYLMDENNFGGARDYFQQYLHTQDDTYAIEAEYYDALCALKLYHLDGEKLIQDFIREHPNSPQSGLAYLEMGEYFFQDRKYKEAITYLAKVDQKVIDKSNKAVVQYKLGYSYFATKNFTKALTEFNKVKKSSSSFKGPAHYYAGFIEYDQADYAAALKDYLFIEKDKAFATSVPYMITSIYYKSQQYAELIKYTKPILDGDSRIQQKGQMSILLSEAYFETEKYSDAYYYFSEAYKTEKFTAQSVYHFGIAAANTGNTERAMQLLKSIAGQGNKVGAMASFALGKLYLKVDNPEFAFTAFKSVSDNKFAGDLKEEAAITSGKLAYTLGRYSESITLLTAFRSDFPLSQYTAVADDILAQAFVNTRNYKPALDYINSLEQKSETIRRAYQQATFHYGVDYYNDREFTQAISYFEQSLSQPIENSYSLKANLWLAEAYSIGRRYELALPYYNAAIKIGRDADTDGYWKARYGRGYALYNTAKYSDALIDFKSYLNSVGEEDINFGDALVRLADCYYVGKDYNSAIKYFGDAIRSNIVEKDYAYYQAGVIYGILDRSGDAIRYLDRVINVYVSSAFYDDALFDKGLIHLKKERYDEAIATFDKLISEKPRSPYVAFSLERSAVANFNLRNYDQTVLLYKQFIEKYPNSPGISDALIGLQESLRLQGNGPEFEQILADFRKENPDISGLEKVEFESLKGLYNSQQYEKAAQGLASFLSAYPNDFNTNEVKYLLAESLYRVNRTDSALSVYYELYKEGGESRLHRISERIADIEFENLNYNASNRFYRELSEIAISNNQKLRSWMGLMNGYFEQANYDSTLYYIDLLIENGGSRNDFIVAATLKKGRTLLNLGQFENALLNFERTTELAKDKNGAEAQYYIGLILHQQEDYINSNEALYVIPEQYGIYSEWLDKGFLLVSENFIAMKEYFQAKATLQSIIDNSTDPNTVQSATDRYEYVTNEETKEVNLIPDSLNTIEIDTSSNGQGN